MSRSLTSLSPRVVIAFLGTWVLALLAANLVPVLIGSLVADLAMTVTAAGALVTAMSLGSAGAMFATNRFVATADRPKVARVGLTVMAVGFGLGALTLQTLPVCVGVILGGIGSGIVIATGTAAASATENPDTTLSTVMIVNRLAAALLLAVMPLIGSDLRTILLILMALGLIGLFTAASLPNLPLDLPATGTKAPVGTLAIVFALVFGLWSLTEDMVYAMTEILAVDHVGLSADTSSLLLSLKVVGGLVGALLAPIALRTIGRSLSILAIIVVSTTAKFLIVTTTSSVVYSVSLVTWGVMYGAVLTLVFGLAARMSVSGRVGVLVWSVYICGIALGPLAGGALISNVSYLAFGIFVAIPSVITGIAVLVVSRRSGVSERGGQLTADEVSMPPTSPAHSA